MTLGGAAAAGVRIIVWCKACQRQIEPDPAELAERFGGARTILHVPLVPRLPLIVFQTGGEPLARVMQSENSERNARVMG